MNNGNLDKTDNLNDIDKHKIQHDCASAPISDTTQDLAKRGKTLEDLWFRKHESELIESARAQNGALTGTNHSTEQKPKCCGGNPGTRIKKSMNSSFAKPTKASAGKVRQLLVLAFGMTYVVFATIAIAVVYGYGATLLSLLAGAIGIAIVNERVK